MTAALRSVIAAIEKLSDRGDLEAVVDAALRRLPVVVDEPAPRKASPAELWAAELAERHQEDLRANRQAWLEQMREADARRRPPLLP